MSPIIGLATIRFRVFGARDVGIGVAVCIFAIVVVGLVEHPVAAVVVVVVYRVAGIASSVSLGVPAYRAVPSETAKLSAVIIVVVVVYGNKKKREK